MTRKRADPDPALAKALNTVEFDPGRSPLFWYLYTHHDDLLRKAKGSRIKWTHVCVDLEPLGLLDGKGKPPTPQRASRTFANVCVLKAREQAARDKQRQARGREPERGANADRPPPVVTTPAPRPPVPYYPPPVSPPPAPLLRPDLALRPHEELSEEEREAYAEAQILRLRRKVAEMSGHDPDEIR